MRVPLAQATVGFPASIETLFRFLRRRLSSCHRLTERFHALMMIRFDELCFTMLFNQCFTVVWSYVVER